MEVFVFLPQFNHFLLPFSCPVHFHTTICFACHSSFLLLFLPIFFCRATHTTPSVTSDVVNSLYISENWSLRLLRFQEKLSRPTSHLQYVLAFPVSLFVHYISWNVWFYSSLSILMNLFNIYVNFGIFKSPIITKYRQQPYVLPYCCTKENHNLCCDNKQSTVFQRWGSVDPLASYPHNEVELQG